MLRPREDVGAALIHCCSLILLYPRCIRCEQSSHSLLIMPLKSGYSAIIYRAPAEYIGRTRTRSSPRALSAIELSFSHFIELNGRYRQP
ncbi:hypothetical protein BV25DRAFT_667943 [Artomyces pyxidatus]|uniref:Uncharacterized protein n=1 Tax=Artomyces pyxidatus TaxID=48021 RepID=A0ACB8T0U4_9AGAM|nr:hypothetical protein BV25DRAFT_667943 [Artomyces pyxidatus]